MKKKSVNEIKEDNFDIWNSIIEMADLTPVILAVYAVCIGPFIILSILNRFCFGKVLGVINDSILFLNNREININGIIEIVYHPRIMTRNGESFCYATFVVLSKNGGMESFDGAFPYCYTCCSWFITGVI